MNPICLSINIPRGWAANSSSLVISILLLVVSVNGILPIPNHSNYPSPYTLDPYAQILYYLSVIILAGCTVPVFSYCTNPLCFLPFVTPFVINAIIPCKRRMANINTAKHEVLFRITKFQT